MATKNETEIRGSSEEDDKVSVKVADESLKSGSNNGSKLDGSDTFMTVGKLKACLADMPDDSRLIYSHDDEGNEYQFVLYAPMVRYIKRTKGYRFLKLIDEKDGDEDEDGEIVDKSNAEKYEKCVCIN